MGPFDLRQMYRQDVQMTAPKGHSLSEVRSNLSSLVRRAARGQPVAITVRGKVQAYLVAQPARPSRVAPLVRGSAKAGKPLAGARAQYLRWMYGEP